MNTGESYVDVGEGLGALEAERVRRDGTQVSLPVRLEADVWIGGNGPEDG